MSLSMPTVPTRSRDAAAGPLGWRTGCSSASETTPRCATTGSVDEDIAAEALAFFEVDHLGLDAMDLKILRTLAETFRGRPVGLNTLASATGEESDTLEDVYEPYLLQLGLLVRTPKGRQATMRAYEHLGVTPPAAAPDQSGLF